MKNKILIGVGGNFVTDILKLKYAVTWGEVLFGCGENWTTGFWISAICTVKYFIEINFLRIKDFS